MKGVPWCQSLPVVDVPQRLVPKSVTPMSPVLTGRQGVTAPASTSLPLA